MPTLHWIGKEKVISHHQDVPYRVLEHKYGFKADPLSGSGEEQKEPTNSGNKIIHGDNLEALKSLLPEYEGKVKCIYIDPPYNTGNEGWIYNDNVNHPKIKKWLGEVVGKDGEDLTRHDKWLCMMYPRLKLLHKLLADDGAIFISIDDNEQANLKLICDEIFGVRNFLGDIIWQHSIQGKNDAKGISLHHNHTLIYSKPNFQIGKIDRTLEHNVAYSNPDNDPKGEWRSGDVRSPNLRENLKYNIITPSGKIISAPEKGWRWSESLVKEKIKIGEIKFSKDENKIIRKIYLSEQKGRVVESIWFGNDLGTTREANSLLKLIFENEVPFDTPKPTGLIERIIKVSSDKNDIILDSFSGSGTTGHAVLKLNKEDGGNRKFILIEMEDYANDITAERIIRVANGYGIGSKAIEGTGGEFDFYELGLPLFDENQNLNEAVDLEKIREYIWFSETRSSYESRQHEYELGIKDSTVYYFIYEKDRLTTLDFDALELIKTKGEQYVIYADNCLLPAEFMAKKNIIFKKIPRDITRF
ncbi:site-specific DNA-methyltransferase [Aquiflexum sp. LQ15W]|uniref:site-specific DNA-methyltransferase n=1 Tax=Cognataquiflexum nitidum TaxID=2922272 RepID=UPI001F138357|nr:site-specific DNA-methyltransferase [Cognataquiflexum nitidum]MCH6201829.1 site-specific DNA-methyltransferase [Cognataquiflexum nitidum]